MVQDRLWERTMKKVEKISETCLVIRDAEGPGYDIYLSAQYSYHAGWYAVIAWPVYPYGKGRQPRVVLSQTYHDTPQAALDAALELWEVTS